MHSEHAAEELDAGSRVVVLPRHNWHMRGLGSLSVPPSDHCPLGHGLHDAPAWPGLHMVQNELDTAALVTVVVPAFVHAVHDVRAATPPALHAPAGHALHIGPPKPGRQTVHSLEPGMMVVVPLGHGRHRGLAKLAFPPADTVPLGQRAHSGRPPKPGRHTGQLSAPGRTDVDSTGQGWHGGRGMEASPPTENSPARHMVHSRPPYPPRQTVQLVDPGTSEVMLLPQSVQLGRGVRLLPPSENLPAGHIQHPEPPYPGRHRVQLAADCEPRAGVMVFVGQGVHAGRMFWALPPPL